VKPFLRYVDFGFSADGGSRYVVLVQFDVFMIGTAKNDEQRHCAKFWTKWLKPWRRYVTYRYVKVAAAAII